MVSTRLMYEDKLEVKRGQDGKPDHRYDMEIDAAEEALFPGGYFPPGLVFSRDTSGKKAKIGCVGRKVAYFLADYSDRPMSSLLGAGASTSAGSMGGFVGGGARMCRFFSCLGHFQISTTQFVKSGNYAVDDALTAIGFATPATYDAAAGRLVEIAWDSTSSVVGIVDLPCASGSETKNDHGSVALHFTSCYMPNRVPAG